ncbi:MAG: Rpp14/Pop5 family protein [Candidatus Hadarchaeaceae archaeon]
MRQRRRYIAFKLIGSEACKSDIMRAISHSLLTHNPAFDRRMLKLVFHDSSSQRGLLRCGHRQVGELKVAMANIKKISGRKASLVILGVSGTLRAAKRKFLGAS